MPFARQAGLVFGLWLALDAVAHAQAPDAAAADAGTSEDAGTQPGAAPAPEPAPQPAAPSTPAAEPAPPDAAPAAAPSPAPVEPPPDATNAPEPPIAPAEDETYQAVAVVPGPGARQPLGRVARNAQRVDQAALDAEHALGVHDALQSRVGGVTVNDVQNNPLQPDLQYRGFTASPLLGTPQGLAVYQGGVRINEVFGDVVLWDLVPQIAVHEVQLIPGPSPLYGLNALGGGIGLEMKNGWNAPGYRVSALAGSFARYDAGAEYGRGDDDWAFYGAVSAFGERGYRDESPSSARYLYADVRQHGPEHEVGVNATVADTDLNGNGPTPIELLEQRRASLYTFPDNTRNRLLLVSADGRRDLTGAVSLHANAYFRHLANDTFNGDEAEFDSCDDTGGLTIVCDEEGSPLLSEGGRTIPASDPLFDALFNTTETISDAFGGSLRAIFDHDVLQRDNQLAVGASYDGGTVAFQQRAELGRLTEERSVSGDGIFLGGDEHRTKLDVDNRRASVFASDTYAFTDAFSLQLAANVNYNQIELHDRLGDALDGDHDFARFNPAAGITYSPVPALTLFASYGESNRAPSAIELACADPDQPCRLPNAFVADPPLDQVVTRAVELGLRGRAFGTRKRPQLSWSLAAFGSRNFDDIIFVAGSRLGTGYFRNAGKTQRIGLEAGGEARTGPLRVYASYALLRATFESALTLSSEAHPLAEDGVIEVEPGDRIPGLPAHSFKAGVTVSPVPECDLSLSTIAQSPQPFRGDEADLLAGVDGYALLNAQVSYWVLEELQLFIKAENLLDAEYETFGVLADPSEVLEDASDPRFLGPGAPRGIWAGIVLRGP